jgi:hypothetical protein
LNNVNSIGANQPGGLWKSAGIGALIGTFFQQPILGALGGLAYKLLSTEGMAESAKKIVGDFANSDDPMSSLGSLLGGKQKAEGDAARSEGPAQQQRSGSGLPTWAKWGIGLAAGAIGLNFLQDNVFSTFLGMPGFGMGFGMPYGNMWNPNMPFMNPYMSPFFPGW